MPNHVINEIRLHGVSIEKVKPLILDGNLCVDFEILLPLPLNYWPGSVGAQHEKAFPGTHLGAARSTWGTKWNAYGDTIMVEDGGDTVVSFQTAWNHPRGWTVALFNTLKCKITAKWLSEGDWTGHVEEYDWSQVEAGFGGWTDTEIPDGSADHRHLHKLLWGVESFDEEHDDTQPPEAT